MHQSMAMKNVLFDVLMAGYQPVLAHPERYIYLYKKWDLFHEIKDKQLSVRQTEELVRRLYRTTANAVKPSPKTTISEAYKRIEDNLASYFSTKVILKHNSNGKGNIVIEYYSNEELNKILELMHAQAD